MVDEVVEDLVDVASWRGRPGLSTRAAGGNGWCGGWSLTIRAAGSGERNHGIWRW